METGLFRVTGHNVVNRQLGALGSQVVIGQFGQGLDFVSVVGQFGAWRECPSQAEPIPKDKKTGLPTSLSYANQPILRPHS